MPDRTPIIVATIGLIGTLAVGILANSDKLSIFFSGRSPNDTVRRPATPPTPDNTVEPVENSASPVPSVPLQATGAPASPTPALDPDANATRPVGAPSTAPKPAQIAGLWTSSDHYNFDFHQSGSVFSYTAKQKGADEGSGSGTISGNKLGYSFTSPDGDGACTATLADDDNSIVGSCHMNDQAWKTWTVEIKRFNILHYGPLSFHQP